MSLRFPRGLGESNRQVGALYLTIHRAITIDAYARASSADNNGLRSRGISTLRRRYWRPIYAAFAVAVIIIPRARRGNEF